MARKYHQQQNLSRNQDQVQTQTQAQAREQDQVQDLGPGQAPMILIFLMGSPVAITADGIRIEEVIA